MATELNYSECKRRMGQAWGAWYWEHRLKPDMPAEVAQGLREEERVPSRLKSVRYILEYRKYRKMLKTAPPELNDRGNEIWRGDAADERLGIAYESMNHNRYVYDDKLCGAGWKQFDTWQDASYFGFWVDLKGFRTFTYCEGDRTLVICPDAEHLRTELEDAERFYGPAPPMAKGIEFETGQVTEFYDERPKVEAA